MSDSLTTVCIPGLASSARLYQDQIPALWTVGPVTVARPTQHEDIGAIAQSILAAAPERFALVGLSMGGYVGFEILRQAPARVAKLALLDTSARPDTPEQSENRRAQVRLAATLPPREIADGMFPRLVHRSRHGDERLRGLVRLMAEEVGSAAYARQQTAITGRPDSRPMLPGIRCPTLVVVGDGDELTPPPVAAEIANGIPGARLVTVADCGHLCTLERPAEVTAALLEWARG